MKKTMVNGLMSILFLSLMGCNGLDEGENTMDLENMGATDNYTALVLKDTVVLAYKDCLYDAKREAAICFDSVVSDSRCPQGAVCIWAGEAVARFTFTAKDYLSTHVELRSGTDERINGYTISFIELIPYPELDKPIKPEEYKAKVVISEFE